MSTTVYTYSDPAKFLKDQWQLRKDKNKAFTLRAWAKHLGFANHSQIQQFIDGRRKIPKKHVATFTNNLDMGRNESLYFETLVDLQRAKSLEEKQIYVNRLTELRPGESSGAVKLKEVEVYKSVQDPLHSLILEMTTLHDFRNDLVWMQNRLHFDVSLEKLKTTIDRLIGLGLLEETAEGELVRTQVNVINPTDVPSQAIREYHRKASHNAAEAVQTQSVEERDFNSFVFNVSRECMPEAKKAIREFILEFAEKFEAKSRNEAHESRQLNVQFFKLTREKGDS